MFIKDTPLDTAYQIEEEAIDLAKAWEEESSELNLQGVKNSDNPFIANPKLHKIFETYEKSALEFEKQGDLQNAWRLRAKAAKAIDIPSYHPLYDMSDKIESQKKKNLDPHTGARISGLDTSM